MAETPVLLLAGFGYVAEATAKRAAGEGWRVLASTRSTETAEAIAARGHEPVTADPACETGRAALRKAAGRAQAILLSAAPGEAGDPFAPALQDLDFSRTWLGYLSTTGVYGDRNGGWAFERDAPSPGQARGVRRVEAEAGWARLGARLFRLSGIYGPGRSALDKIRAGEMRVFDKPGHVFSRIHVDDIAAALTAAMARPGAQGAFNLADDHPSSQAEVMLGAAALLGAPAPEIITFDPEQASPMLASFYAECRRVSNARAKAVLGWRPAYRSWREGLAAIVSAGA
ncbi:MAG: SDR family NAD(P)-dependent oxidoreductase [Oceanicaulis sp.]